MKQNVLAMLLAAALAFSLLPGTAFAGEASETDDPGSRLASAKNGTVALKPANEVRWIDRFVLPDFALALYEALEEAADGDGYNDYLIDREYFDLDGEDVLSNGEPGDFIRGSVAECDGSVFRYAGILAATAVTVEADRDYIFSCIQAAHTAFIRDHPKVFWLYGMNLVVFERGDKTYYCYSTVCRYQGETTPYFDIRRPDFQPGGSLDIRRVMARCDEDTEKILSTIPAGADRFAQIYYLNDWLAEHNSYNVKNGSDAPWYATQCISALEGLSGENGPVCGGYASAFKVLCDALDIPCVLVHAEKFFAPLDHIWNYVQMEDGEWYAVDVTFNDGGDHAANRTEWLLVGGQEFLESHPAENPSGFPGVPNFTNGPALSDDAYPRGFRLAYTGMPEKLILGDSVTMMPNLIFASGAAYVYSSSDLPSGLTLNPNTGKITGTVTDASNPVAVTVTASNPDDPADCAGCTLRFPTVEPFIDVPGSAWYAGAVTWAAGKGYVAGTGNGMFTPDRDCTNVEILTFLWNAEGKPTAAAAPVTVADWAQGAVNWAYAKGLIDGTFQPYDPCTRAATVYYIWQAFGKEQPAGSVSFPDVDKSAAYAGAVAWAAGLNIVKGTGGGAYAPDSVCSRSQIAVFLHRAYVPEARI